MFKTQRAAADVLGIANPFYRRHEAKAGAHSVIGNQPVLNFASYDYLGLNGHPEITQAVSDVAREWGTSVSASRITAGERGFHQELERQLAENYQTEDAITFVSGHATAVTVVAALMGPKDLVLHDAPGEGRFPVTLGLAVPIGGQTIREAFLTDSTPLRLIEPRHGAVTRRGVRAFCGLVPGAQPSLFEIKAEEKPT